MISLDKCNGICFSVDDLPKNIFVCNKRKSINVIVFNRITQLN